MAAHGAEVVQPLSASSSWAEYAPPYSVAEYVVTHPTANKVSRRALIMGSSNIMLGGKCIIKTGAVLRGDLKRPIAPPPSTSSLAPPPATPASRAAAQRAAAIAAAAARSGVVISAGRYCLFDQGCIVRPPYKTYKGSFSYFAIKMGDCVRIGPGSVVQASAIGSHVDIGRNCIVGRWSYIKDSAVVLDGTVLAPNTMVPSLTVWAGSPGTHATRKRRQS